MLNAIKDNGTTETIEKPDKLRHTLEGKKVDVINIGGDQDILIK